VRNYQARNFMRQMQPGDGVLFYHSSTAVPGVAGIARVAGDAYPDPTQFDPRSDYHDPKSMREDPRWSLVDVEFERKLARVIPLDEIRALQDRLGEFALLQRGTRLSVLPLTATQWKLILGLEKKQPA
jgi:predicted RNA-binding protein with PUA-like domain